MAYVLLGAALGLIPSLMMLVLHLQTIKSYRLEQESWKQERESLLNRCMTKEWQSYQMMQVSHPSQISPLNSEPYYAGMSDEEELRRIGEAYAGTEGVGEENYPFAEMEADALSDLGFRTE